MDPSLHCRLNEWIDTHTIRFHDNDSPGCGVFYFDDYPAMILELPADLVDFMETYGKDGRIFRGWSFADLGHVTGRENQRHVVFGGNYLGLGYYFIYVYDRDTKDIKMINEDSTVMRQYPSWSDAIQDLVDHDFGWEMFLCSNVNL